MKKKLLSLVFLLLASISVVYAYDYRVRAPTGQILYYIIRGDGEACVTYPNTYSHTWDGYTQPTGSLTIPPSINVYDSWGVQHTYPVTMIDYAAFRGCTSLTSVTISTAGLIIGSCAFEGCHSLVSVISVLTDSENEMIEIHIPDSAFYGCTNLVGFNILSDNHLVSIGTSAFENCTSLNMLGISEHVRYVSKHAFKNSTLQL